MSLQKPKLCQYVVLANKLYFSHNRPALNREAFRQDLLTAHFNLNTFCGLDKSLFRRALGEKGSNLTVTGSVEIQIIYWHRAVNERRYRPSS